MKSRFLLILTLLVAWSAALGDETALRRFEYSAEKMGVPVRLTFYADSDELASAAAEAVWKRFDELNDALSDWDPESELIRACRAAEETREPVAPSDDLRRALEESRKFCILTDGAFDPTVGPIVKLWRRSRYFHERPPRALLEQAKGRVGLDVWTIDERGFSIERGARLDFGGIAKGMALDDALETLERLGIKSALVNASGDLRIGDPPPGKTGWRVGAASLNDEPAFYCELSNVGVASSGDANRYVEIDGVRYSHIVDPRSREPLTRRCVSVVLAPTATTADALASALCVLGVEESQPTFERLRREGANGAPLEPLEYALIVVKDAASDPPYEDSELEIVASPGFQALLEASRRAAAANKK